MNQNNSHPTDTTKDLATVRRALIPLTKGKFAIIDAEDFEKVSQYKWHFSVYAITSIDGNQVRMHRFVTGDTTSPQIDHINGNCLDNRKANLRGCTAVENARNMTKAANCSSKYKGVFHKTNSWEAYIHMDDKKISLGRFPTEEHAAWAYNVAAKKHFGRFAKLNEVNEPTDGFIPQLPNAIKMFCKQGHMLSEDNVRVYKNRGWEERICLTCKDQWNKNRYAGVAK